MISLKQAENTLLAYSQSMFPKMLLGVLSPGGKIPKYIKNGSLPICVMCKQLVRDPNYCQQFYNSCDFNRHGTVRCPFGVHLEYVASEHTKQPLAFFVQKSFTETSLLREFEKNLPRKKKKIFKRAKVESRDKKCEFREHALFRLLQVGETLLAGRVAAPMRALSHQLLTPVQAVMSDLKFFRYQRKSDENEEAEEILQLMNDNVAEINSITKQIHILLSEELSPSPQSIRRVTDLPPNYVPASVRELSFSSVVYCCS
ncbi:hypothetical protein STSP2_02023 [Anaerohalosphaera lusitana]|uniref:Uncharacterized protein n=1 Tax=Anaerohalosphaera lusitana TaxID=1936003 RepID=A0A1U9NM15_9BACT|nr:hypothetical protein [Anaerohalosphaera lusitana]AQT68847.1 hypothetical protein STSP2_02023 [Anaerohalosphaera lusitana]